MTGNAHERKRDNTKISGEGEEADEDVRLATFPRCMYPVKVAPPYVSHDSFTN